MKQIFKPLSVFKWFYRSSSRDSWVLLQIHTIKKLRGLYCNDIVNVVAYNAR